MTRASPPTPAGPGMIIEFIGLPGAGKSTLSHQVAALLRAAGETVSEESFNLAHRRGPIRRRLVKVRFAVATLLRFPMKSAALVRMIAPARSATPVATTVKTLELLYVCGLVAQQARRPGIHLLDQGFFTSLGAVCLDTQARVALGPLIDLGSACCRRSPADLVVVLEVSPGTVLSRLADRPGRTSRLEKRAAEPGFDRHLRAAVGLLERIRGAIGAPDRPWEVQVVREHDPGSATMLAERIKSATVSPFFPPSKTTAVVSLSHED